MFSAAVGVICRKAAAGITKWKCSGGRHRMMSSSGDGVDQWRISPWLMLPPAVDCGVEAYKMYSLASNKVLSFKKEEPSPAPTVDQIVGSSHGWVATFNRDNHHIFLRDPISGRQMKLPDINTLPESSFSNHTFVNKIILTCSPSAEECRAVMTFCVGWTALCRPGGDKWTWLGDRYYEDYVYSSRHKRFFCLARIDANHDKEKLESWDLSDPSSPTRDGLLDLTLNLDRDYPEKTTKSEDEAEVMDAYPSRSVRYLVFAEQSDQLFLVVRHILENTSRDGSCVKSIYFGEGRSFDLGDCYPYRTFAFDVYEIDWKGDQGGGWRYVEDGSLNGLAMFVGNNHSFALSTADGEFPELKPNSIYFTEDEEMTPWPLYEINYENYGGHDNGIFNYMDRKFSSVYYSSHASDIARISPSPIWFTPKSNLT